MSRSCPACGTTYPDDVSFCGHDGNLTIQDQDPSTFDARLGSQLGPFVLVARVADGAMGRVYEARHPETKERVAIKVLHPMVARDFVSTERFRREYETARELDHPHVVQVLEFGMTPEEVPYMTMEYLEGEPLGALLAREGRVEPARLVRIVSQAAGALAHAHSFGVIHRDLKPDNLFLVATEKGDQLRILDFGSVKLQMEMGPKLTAMGTTLGTPLYMSPEQAMGKLDVDLRTDVYALAALTYEMLCGRGPFKAESVGEILRRVVTERAPPPSTFEPSIPASVDAVVLRGIEKDKTKRPASAPEFAAEFTQAWGLGDDPAQWSGASTVQIRAALEAIGPNTEPPSPTPIRAEPGAPAAGEEGAAPEDRSRAGQSFAPGPLPTASRRPLMIGAGIFLLISVVGAILLLMGR